MILDESYVQRVRGQLQHQEEKKAEKKGSIKMDGRAKILTQNDLIDLVRAHDTAREEEARLLEARKDGRERYKEAIEKWDRYEVQRKERNAAATKDWEQLVVEWTVERDRAKGSVGRPGWNKPKKPPAEKQVAKPRLKA